MSAAISIRMTLWRSCYFTSPDEVAVSKASGWSFPLRFSRTSTLPSASSSSFRQEPESFIPSSKSSKARSRDTSPFSSSPTIFSNRSEALLKFGQARNSLGRIVVQIRSNERENSAGKEAAGQRLANVKFVSNPKCGTQQFTQSTEVGTVLPQPRLYTAAVLLDPPSASSTSTAHEYLPNGAPICAPCTMSLAPQQHVAGDRHAFGTRRIGGGSLGHPGENLVGN